MICFCFECGWFVDILVGYEVCCLDWLEVWMVLKCFVELCVEMFRFCVSWLGLNLVFLFVDKWVVFSFDDLDFVLDV